MTAEKDIHNQQITVALLVPDGIGVRNYLYSDVLLHLKNCRVVLMHDLPDEVLNMVEQLHGKAFISERLPLFRETRTNDLLRRICMFSRLHLNAKILRNPFISKNWFFFSTKRGWDQVPFRILDLLSGCVALFPGLHEWLEKRLASRMIHSQAGRAYAQTLEKINPDIILCTHQRSVEAGYLMTVAKHKAIQTATVIFSWDNLPKSRITFRPDHYLVWSTFMKEELLEIYPWIREKQVHITGTPQFEHYYTPGERIWTRAVFEQKLHIPAGRPVICFSGNEPNFPSDHLYLKDLLEELDKAIIADKPMVVVRPSPADTTGRLEAVAARFPHLAVVSRPQWKSIGNRDWESFYATPEDGLLLMNLLFHCSAVINNGSTMGLDFAHFNKPALYIQYNHPECAWFNLVAGYEQEHLKPLNASDAVVFIRSKPAFLPAIQSAISNPDRIATERLAWKKCITDDIEHSSKRVANVLKDLASENAR